MVAIRIRGILAALVVSKMMNNPDEARRVGRRRELPLSTLNCRSRSRHRNGCFEGATAIRPIKLADEQSVPLRPLEPPPQYHC
jgi:hypothetical protein